MITIGQPRTVRVRAKGVDGKLAFKLGADGKPEMKTVNADVWRETRETLGGQHGRYKRKKLVVGLVGVDQLVLYPKGTRQEVRVNLVDVYAWSLRGRAQRAQLETARERKLKLQTARIKRQIANADRRRKVAIRKEAV